MPTAPYFSIVVATYNAARNLKRALNTVLAQDFGDWEILVQDGGSTDATLDIVNALAGDGRVHLVSKPDNGVYDAWNRAVFRARGQWALFLGADDFLADGTVLGRCAARLQELEQEIVFAYGILALGKDGEVTTIIDRSRHDAFNILLQDMGLPFPATFVRMAFLKTHPFDASFKIAGDYDLVAAHVSLDNLARLPICISYFELGGLSSDEANKSLLLQERRRILRTRIRPRLAELTRALEGALPFAADEHGLA